MQDRVILLFGRVVFCLDELLSCFFVDESVDYGFRLPIVVLFCAFLWLLL